MAIYKLNSEKAKNRTSKARKITGFSLIGASSLVFLFMTGIVPALQKFFLGVFGVFGYVLCIALIIIGLAVLNKRRYVMPKRYAVYLIISVILLLCVLQLIIVGNKFNADGTKMGFWKYLGKNYSKTWTAGGILVGLLTTPILYIANLVGAYLIFLVGLAITISLLVDTLNHLKKEKVANEPVSLQVKESEEINEPEPLKTRDEKVKEETNVVLNGKLKEDNPLPPPPTAKEMLGLDHKRNYAFEYHEGGQAQTLETAQVSQNAAKESVDPSNWKKYILTPPQVDIDEYFKNIRSRNNAPTKAEVDETIGEMKGTGAQETEKQEPTFEQAQIDIPQEAQDFDDETIDDVQEDEFVDDSTPFARTLEDTPTEELVDNVDDILQQVVEDEKLENPERFETSEPTIEETNIAERNVIDRIPERNNSGAFERRSFDRMNDRMMSQEDRDARDSFNRDRATIDMRNGNLAREVAPIQPEEEEEIVPYEYQKPSLDFITTKSVDLETFAGDTDAKRIALEDALSTFGIAAKVQDVVVGPAVTRYELEMPQGVSVAKIKNHVDDIAYALAAEGAIRVEAPVPGKSVVGIEVPNMSVATVSLRDILESPEFQNSHSPLTFAIGKDITGKIVCANMQKLTHAIVAGTTGSGKSVCLHSIILSVLYKASPEDVKLMIIDPKRVEFSSYEGLPHLIMPKIINDTQKAQNALVWAVDEMERRFEMMGLARVKNIDEFNQTEDVKNHKVKKMPFIVIIVDEFADLMMTGGKSVEDNICRLAQKARAAGIHIILATQRPSREFVTGAIKANFPSRISLAVSSSMDSMVVLDRVGAEKLLGKGDMLYYPIGAKDPVRVQGCYVGPNEINNIVDFVRDNNEPIFDRDIEAKINNPNKPSDETPKRERDVLFQAALKACIDAGTASTTMLRRKFAIGFSRAGTLIDDMEEAGYISTANGAKPRSVYITEEEYNQIFGSEE